MSLVSVTASNTYVQRTIPTTLVPNSAAFWVMGVARITTFSDFGEIVCLSPNVDSNWFGVVTRPTSSGISVVRKTGASFAETNITGFSAGVWYLVIGVFDIGTNRAIYVIPWGGGTESSGATADTTTFTASFTLAEYGTLVGTTFDLFTGDIAWGAAGVGTIGADKRQAIARKANPFAVLGDQIRELTVFTHQGPIPYTRGGNGYTLGSGPPTFIGETPLWEEPRRRVFFVPAAPPGGLSIPVAMHDYRRRRA